MNSLNRFLVPILAAAITIAVALPLSEGSMIPVIINGVIALIVGLLVFHTDILVKDLSSDRVFYTIAGFIFGLMSAFFLGQIAETLLMPRPYFPVVYIVPVALCLFAGNYVGRSAGLQIATRSRHDEEPAETTEKILDTSVIIDGRILDIAQTNFMEGPFIIPNFVLREIQLISDSPDPIKRNRGRRGLEMLNKLQQLDNIKVKISYADYTDTREVDAKLVKLSRETGGKLVTNDFNLNKVAELQGVEVLNLNSLTNALKPIVLPGEDIQIEVIKEGKDENQGIGYLEDGTMVVVENGRSLLGKHITVNVTSIIQTAAGKMIFTKATGQIHDDPHDDDLRNAQQKLGDQYLNSSAHNQPKKGNGRRDHYRGNRNKGDQKQRS